MRFGYGLGILRGWVSFKDGIRSLNEVTATSVVKSFIIPAFLVSHWKICVTWPDNGMSLVDVSNRTKLDQSHHSLPGVPISVVSSSAIMALVPA